MIVKSNTKSNRIGSCRAACSVQHYFEAARDALCFSQTRNLASGADFNHPHTERTNYGFMKNTAGLLFFPSLFLASSAVVVAFAPRILISKTTGYQHHYYRSRRCLTAPCQRVGALSSVIHCSRRSSSNNHNTFLADYEGGWDRLTLNAEASWLCFILFSSFFLLVAVDFEVDVCLQKVGDMGSAHKVDGIPTILLYGACYPLHTARWRSELTQAFSFSVAWYVFHVSAALLEQAARQCTMWQQV